MLEPSERLAPDILHVRYEKDGITFEHPPIAWNADAVIVEANLRLPTARNAGARLKSPPHPVWASTRLLTEFQLHVGATGIHPESLRLDSPDSPAKLTFRFPPPAQSVLSELTYKGRRLGQITLPVFQKEEFLANVRVEAPTVHAMIGESIVACKTFVFSQTSSLFASGVLVSPTSLAPMTDLPLRVEWQSASGEVLSYSEVKLTSTQLTGKRALAVASLRRPRRACNGEIRWLIGDKVVATSRLAAVTKSKMERSLRLCATRLILESPTGTTRVVRSVVGEEPYLRLSPCFLISSHEASAAGKVSVQIDAVRKTTETIPVSCPDVVLTEGMVAVVSDRIASSELRDVDHFVIHVGKQRLGLAPISSAPRASFTAEGGLASSSEYVWSPAAEEELEERLRKLIQGG